LESYKWVRTLALRRHLEPTLDRYSSGPAGLERFRRGPEVARGGRLRCSSEPVRLLRSKRPDQHLDCDAVLPYRTSMVPAF
jgi:hypothetical protein